MDAITENELLKPIRDSWIPPFSGSIPEWASQYVSLPDGHYRITGKFDVSISRYLIQPFDDLLNPDVRQVNIVSAVKTFKSGIGEIFIPYLIVNDPGPVLKIHQTHDMAKNQTKVKLLPLLKHCKPVNELMLSAPRHSVTTTEMSFPGTEIKISGPSDNILQTLDIRYLLLEETYKLKKNVIEEVKARTTSFEANCKILLSSQPGEVGDDTDIQFNSGICYSWAWLCPECHNYNVDWWNVKKPEWTKEKPVYAGMKWDKIYLKDGKTYDLDAMGDTARLVCYHCPCESLIDTEANRRYLNDTGKYVCTKSEGIKSIHSYTWPAFANQSISFKSKVIQYLQASDSKDKTGNSDKLKMFEQKVLGRPISKAKTLTYNKIVTKLYDPKTTLLDDTYVNRFLSVDYQSHLSEKWYVIRVAKDNGESRLIKYGHVHDWAEIDTIAKEYGIEPYEVLLDSGFNTQECYEQSVKHGKYFDINGEQVWLGWTCMKGSDYEDFKHDDGIRRYYQESFKDPQLYSDPSYAGKMARLMTWSVHPIRTILHHLKDGQGVKWENHITDEVYERHLSCEQLVDVVNAKTGLIEKKYRPQHSDNHLYDCELQIIAAMYAKGLIGDYANPSQSIEPAQDLPLAA